MADGLEKPGARGKVARPMQSVLDSMMPTEVEALQAFLGREASAEDFTKVDPVKFNHAMLEFMEQVVAVRHLRPCEVEKLTSLHHQHLLKLHPHPEAMEDVHVSAWTLVLFCNGLHIRLRTALAWIMGRLLPCLLPLMEPLEA